MAGLARAFQTGFNMADSVEREEENKRRYGLQQERLDRQEARQVASDERQGKLFDANMEQIQHQKERRPILEAQQDQSFKTQQQTANLQQKEIKQNLLIKKKEIQTKEIGDAWNVGWTEFQETGTISPETYERMNLSGQGTAFDITNLTDPTYIKSLDNLNNASRYGLGNSDPKQLIGDFNTVFKSDINKIPVIDGSAYNKVTDATVDKKGNFTFKVTAYDGDGKPLKSVYTGDAVPYEKLIDGAFSRKAIVASVISQPQFKAQLDYAHSKFGAKTTDKLGYSNIKYAQTLYRDIIDDAEKNKREIRRAYQGIAMSDPKKMQAELDAVDEQARAKIGELGSMFSPSEISQARIPTGTGYGLGSGSSAPSEQSNNQNDQESAKEELKAFLAKQGLKMG